MSFDEAFTFGGKTIDQIAREPERTWNLQGVELFRTNMGFAVTDPRAQARIAGLTERIPVTYRPPRPPFWTRHMLGVIEAERDRRLHRR